MTLVLKCKIQVILAYEGFVFYYGYVYLFKYNNVICCTFLSNHSTQFRETMILLNL